MEVKLKKKAVKALKKGETLLHSDDLIDGILTNKWIDFVDEKGKFVGKVFLGKKNNGIGWCLSRKKIFLDKNFFSKRFVKAKLKKSFLIEKTATPAFTLQ